MDISVVRAADFIPGQGVYAPAPGPQLYPAPQLYPGPGYEPAPRRLLPRRGVVMAPDPYDDADAGYEPAPHLRPPAPVYGGGCYWTRGEARWDGYRWVRPRIQVCD
jgi:hypothetical protein